MSSIRGEEVERVESSSEEEEEIEYYCFTVMSACPQAEFEMVDSIYDLKELAQVLRGKAKWIKH